MSKMQIPEALRDEYFNLWPRASIRLEWTDEARERAKLIASLQERYKAVALIPWWMVGVIHSLEADCDFDRYLHNGDPMFDRAGNPVATVNDPAGIGPFKSWEEGARDAQRRDFGGWTMEDEGGIAETLYSLECFNSGAGNVKPGRSYRAHGINSPYLWSGTNYYERGKYVADDRYDPNARSAQIGAVPILKWLIDLKVISPLVDLRPQPIISARASRARIERLQDFLNREGMGLDGVPLDVDGKVGPMTEKIFKAVFGFQMAG